eukprot:21775-Prymnesium_polylepis.2
MRNGRGRGIYIGFGTSVIPWVCCVDWQGSGPLVPLCTESETEKLEGMATRSTRDCGGSLGAERLNPFLQIKTRRDELWQSQSAERGPVRTPGAPASSGSSVELERYEEEGTRRSSLDGLSRPSYSCTIPRPGAHSGAGRGRPLKMRRGDTMSPPSSKQHAPGPACFASPMPHKRNGIPFANKAAPAA